MPTPKQLVRRVERQIDANARLFFAATSETGHYDRVEPAASPGMVRYAADIVAKVFLGDKRNFLEPLIRFARGDVRDHIVSHKNDHGPS